MKRSHILWASLALSVFAAEMITLFHPSWEPLSPIVIGFIQAHPETLGALVFLLLAWLIYHWFIVPLIRARQEEDEDS